MSLFNFNSYEEKQNAKKNFYESSSSYLESPFKPPILEIINALYTNNLCIYNERQLTKQKVYSIEDIHTGPIFIMIDSDIFKVSHAYLYLLMHYSNKPTQSIYAYKKMPLVSKYYGGMNSDLSIPTFPHFLLNLKFNNLSVENFELVNLVFLFQDTFQLAATKIAHYPNEIIDNNSYNKLISSLRLNVKAETNDFVWSLSSPLSSPLSFSNTFPELLDLGYISKSENTIFKPLSSGNLIFDTRSIFKDKYMKPDSTSLALRLELNLDYTFYRLEVSGLVYNSVADIDNNWFLSRQIFVFYIHLSVFPIF